MQDRRAARHEHMFAQRGGRCNCTAREENRFAAVLRNGGRADDDTEAHPVRRSFRVRPRLPLLPLASACRDAGHEVHIATGGDFVRRLRGLGFSTHAVGMPIEQAHEIALERPGMWPPAR